jgi:K+-transporting ATPase c subunit
MPQVMNLISANTLGRGLGFSGEPSVDVLDLNLALDKLTGANR